MAALPQISDAEWDVMKVVWEHGPLTAGDVVRHLSPDTSWKPRTIKTLLTRLVRKGAAEMQEQGRVYLYRAKVSREAVRRQETRSFLSRVFDGAVTPAVVHFLKQADLSPQEIEQLRRILDEEAK